MFYLLIILIILAILLPYVKTENFVTKTNKTFNSLDYKMLSSNKKHIELFKQLYILFQNNNIKNMVFETSLKISKNNVNKNRYYIFIKNIELRDNNELINNI